MEADGGGLGRILNTNPKENKQADSIMENPGEFFFAVDALPLVINLRRGRSEATSLGKEGGKNSIVPASLKDRVPSGRECRFSGIIQSII